MSESRNRDHEQAKAWLKAYAQSRCERAFEELVRFYSGLVYASALRLTASPQLAEEVAQDVFALMARKAKSLIDHSSITGWIYVTTRYVARDVMKTENRKRASMAKLGKLKSKGTPSVPPDNATPWLDEALHKLREPDRNVLLWHYFEERSFGEIGRRLGKSEVACRKQSSRALEKLGSILRRDGYIVPPVAIIGALSAQLCKAAPPAITSGILKTSTLSAASIPSSTVILNSIQTMAFTKTKTAIVVTALAAIPIGLQWNENHVLKQRLLELSANQTRIHVEPNLTSTMDGMTGDASGSNQTVPNGLRRSKAPKASNWPGDRATFALPRELLNSLNIGVMDESTLAIDDKMKTVLELTSEETQQLEEGIRALRQQIWDHERSHVEELEVSENRQAYFIPAFPEVGQEIKEGIGRLAKDTLGDERAAFFMHRFSILADGRLRTFGRFGEYGRQIEFTYRDDQDRIGVKVSHYDGPLEEGKHRMQRGASVDEVPQEFRHLFREEVSPAQDR